MAPGTVAFSPFSGGTVVHGGLVFLILVFFVHFTSFCVVSLIFFPPRSVANVCYETTPEESPGNFKLNKAVLEAPAASTPGVRFSTTNDVNVCLQLHQTGPAKASTA